MLGRLVAKLMFKACVPLVTLAGVMSYGVYLKGGDPAGLWKHVASGAFDQAGSMFMQAKDGASGLAGNVSDAVVGASSGSGSAVSTQVFTWQDEQGVTHFGTSAPNNVQADTITIDPNVNVLAPVRAPAAVPIAESVQEHPASDDQLSGSLSINDRTASRSLRTSSSQNPVQQLESEMGEPLPGIAGQILSNGAPPGNGLDPAQLIRLIQTSGVQ